MSATRMCRGAMGAVGIGCLVLAASLGAQPPATGAATGAASAPASPVVSRADLAARYLAMDALYAAADSAGRLSDSTRRFVNRTFDRSTLSFFGGRFAVTAAIMDTAMRTVFDGYAFVRPAMPDARVRGRPASVARAALLQRLARVDSTGPLAQAWLSAERRARLLVDTISPERSAEFLAEPAALAAAVEREVAALERGRNPYVGAEGDRWRAFRGANGSVVPMRVIAPTGAASTPLGVLIALHGAGGDENMFPMGYGRGIAARLAREAGLLFVSPATTPFSQSPEQFDSLLTVLGREYRLDPARVYVMGHSMGANATARLVQQRPAAIAAAACLAGGSAVTVAGAPPVLFIGAELDPIIAARTVKAAAAATPTGTYEERAGEGHTLMVRGATLRAIPWLLTHRRP